MKEENKIKMKYNLLMIVLGLILWESSKSMYMQILSIIIIVQFIVFIAWSALLDNELGEKDDKG